MILSIILGLIFVVGLLGSTILGSFLARRLFVRPDPKYPLNTHSYRGYFFTVTGGGLFFAIWLYSWSYLLFSRGFNLN